jgi:hypothetical protein
MSWRNQSSDPENGARQRRGALRKEPTVIDWDRAWDGVERILAELYGDKTSGMSTETSG